MKAYNCEVVLVVWLYVVFVQVNPELKGNFEEKGFRFVGQDVEGERMEVIELDGKEDAIYHMDNVFKVKNSTRSFSCSVFRSSIFCWSAVPPRVHLSPH